ncbi:hypothetical protein GCM10008018_33950 [Paenibacillus marchantiophytorum]|uniref:Uncharacterized protein n=1 Tax=Paenibacillus marchantiophytorum TaxID=1619310 RepID=A0ABQ1ET98_9BACL|nr:hypothetical protein [Paenibacillus marchantiophytorum]GFZ85105.1 hypothetical protein GCM10008018_33950 [Paenibacillus marchantiophytorum]
MVAALAALLRFISGAGSKAISFITSAFSVIWKYGSAGVQWVKDNWLKIATVLALFNDVVDFINWITDELKAFFGY